MKLVLGIVFSFMLITSAGIHDTSFVKMRHFKNYIVSIGVCSRPEEELYPMLWMLQAIKIDRKFVGKTQEWWCNNET